MTLGTLARSTRRWVLHCGREAPTDPLELWTIGNAAAWGAWLALPMFQVFSKTYYLGMATLAPESVWGGFALVAALAQLYGRAAHRRVWVQIGATGVAALWWFAAGALVYQNWTFATTVMYPMMGTASLFIVWRVGALPRRL